MNKLAKAVMLMPNNLSNTIWDGASHHYTFDNNVLDLIGSNNGTNSGGTSYVSGVVNQAISYDGINGVTNFADNIFPQTNDFSLVFWFNPISFSGPLGTIISNFFTPDAINFYGWNVYMTSSTNMRFRLYDATVFSDMDITVTSGSNNFISIVRKAGVSNEIYLNNVLVLSNSGGFTPTYQATQKCNLAVLNFNGTPLFYSNQIVDILTTYERYISPSEVSNHWNSGAGIQY
jgi:hypothetical protein